MRNPFDAILRVGQITSPLLFLHSPEDTIVPFNQGRQLFEAARASKTFIEIRGGHVNSAELDGPTFFGAVNKFLHATVLKLDPAFAKATARL